jgi:DNA (cytosine-5)-methyltransferase 1
MTKFKEWDIGAIDLLVGGTPCQSHSQSQGLEKAWQTQGATLPSPIVQFLTNLSPNGLSGKTSLAFCQAQEDGTLVPSLGRWGKSGMGSPTECWTLNGLESPKDVDVCSLSDVLETGEVPQRFFLSEKACAGDLAPSREKGQKVAPTVVQGPPYSRTGNERVECDAIVLGNVEGGNATTLSAREYKGLSCGRDGMTSAAVVYGAQALRPSVQSHHAQVFVAQTTVYERHDQDARLKEVNVSPTLHAKSDNTCDLPVVLQPIPFDTTQITSPYNYSNPQSGDPCHPLATGAHPPAIVQPIGLDEEQNAMVNAFGTLKARTEGGGFEGTVMQTDMAVRRLTPTECERLQGFPDGYTDIQPNGKPTPDGPRYKALGNSMAVPVMKWIGERIEQQAKHKGAQTSCDH